MSETEVTVDHVEDDEAVEVGEDVQLGEGVFSRPHSRHDRQGSIVRRKGETKIGEIKFIL